MWSKEILVGLPRKKIRECYESGKVGHLRPDCPELPKNRKKHDNMGHHARSADVFVASLNDHEDIVRMGTEIIN